MTEFWKFFIKREHFTVLLMLVLVAVGAYSAIAIPKESSPAIVIPIGIITTVLPGASASDVEQLVTNKIEDRVLSVENVSKVTSSSADGMSSITVQFTASADITKSIQLLKDEVDKVRTQLPTDALAPTVTQINFSDQPIVIASISGALAPGELTAVGQSVQSDLERVPGVSTVDLSGVRAREVQVIIQQAKLRQYNIPVSTIINAIQASGLASPAGSISVNGVNYDVKLNAGIATPEDMPSAELEVTFETFSTLNTRSSILFVTSCSTSLAEAPGSTVVMIPIGMTIAGDDSLGIAIAEYAPTATSTSMSNTVKCSRLIKNFQNSVMGVIRLLQN